MYAQSLTDIPNMQKRKRLRNVFSLFDPVTISYKLIVGIMVVIYNVYPKMTALYFWVAIPLMYFAQAQLTGIYGSLRPFMLKEDIKIPDSICSPTFGGPSEECTLLSFAVISAYLNQYYEVGEKPVKF